jgi:hypothetical protein
VERSEESFFSEAYLRVGHAFNGDFGVEVGERRWDGSRFMIPNGSSVSGLVTETVPVAIFDRYLNI